MAGRAEVKVLPLTVLEGPLRFYRVVDGGEVLHFEHLSENVRVSIMRYVAESVAQQYPDFGPDNLLGVVQWLLPPLCEGCGVPLEGTCRRCRHRAIGGLTQIARS